MKNKKKTNTKFSKTLSIFMLIFLLIKVVYNMIFKKSKMLN